MADRQTKEEFRHAAHVLQVAVDLDARSAAKDAAEAAARAVHNAEMIAQRLDSHLANCEKRYDVSDRRQDRLEDDLKVGFKAHTDALNKVSDGFADSIRRVHGRFDALYRVAMGLLVAIILSALGVIATMVWDILRNGING